MGEGYSFEGLNYDSLFLTFQALFRINLAQNNEVHAASDRSKIDSWNAPVSKTIFLNFLI